MLLLSLPIGPNQEHPALVSYRKSSQGTLARDRCLHLSPWSTLWLSYLHWLLSEAACSYTTAEQGPIVSW